MSFGDDTLDPSNPLVPAVLPARRMNNTKAEKVAEAIEDLAVAAAISALNPTHESYENVKAARRIATEAMGELLQPALRVVRG